MDRIPQVSRVEAEAHPCVFLSPNPHTAERQSLEWVWSDLVKHQEVRLDRRYAQWLATWLR